MGHAVPDGPPAARLDVHLVGEAWNIMQAPEARQPAKELPQEQFLFPYLANGVTLVQALSATPEEAAGR